MQKCMLMMDMPKDCYSCPCREMGENSREVNCRLKNQSVHILNTTIPSWCPLMPVDMKQVDSIIKATKEPDCVLR